jgi:hypothetical protein
LASKRLGKKLLKIAAYTLGIIVVLAVAAHLWFIYRAKDMLEEMVEKKSGGKLKLKIEKLSYSYFSRKMRIREAAFYSSDTATAYTAYRFNTPEINVKLKAILPFIIENPL